MLSEIPDDEFAAALDACAAEVLWEAGISEPPVDALAVAERLELVVARDFAMPYRGRFVRLADRHGRRRRPGDDRRRPGRAAGARAMGGRP